MDRLLLFVEEMLVFLFFFCLFEGITGANVPQCSKLHVEQNTSRRIDLEVVYKFDLDVDVVKSSIPYFNYLKFFNFNHESIDENYFKQINPLQYWDGNEGILIKCNDTVSCTIEVPDGVGLLELPIFLNGTKDFPDLLDDLFIDSGIVYLSYNGQFFDPNGQNCISIEEISMSNPDFVFFTAICCREYSYVTVPDSNDNPCVEFDSNTVFVSNVSSDVVIANFSAHYALLDSELVVTVTGYTGPPTGNFYFSPNEDLIYCAGNASGCDFQQDLPQGDFQFGFLLDIWDPYPQTFHYDTVTGKLIRRNGIFMKEENSVFRPEDPCWTRTAYGNNASVANSKFCCSRFRADITVDCPQYRSRSEGFENDLLAVFMDITYTVSLDNLDIFINNFTSGSGTLGQFEIINSQGNFEICRVNSTFGTSDCSFHYSNNNAYEFDFRTSGFPDGFNMTLVSINNLQFESPYLNPNHLCQKFNQPYNGLDSSKTSITEFCCITRAGGPWPGSL